MFHALVDYPLFVRELVCPLLQDLGHYLWAVPRWSQLVVSLVALAPP